MVFKPEQSGNPEGGSIGSLNKTTLTAQQLLDGEAEKITGNVLRKQRAAILWPKIDFIERILPRRKSDGWMLLPGDYVSLK